MARLLQTRCEKIKGVSLEILINEVYPNPESGSEWVEFLANGEIDENLNLSNYTIFDSYHQIYKFSDEKFTDQILVVEVSGLNNDQDSVILKDSNGAILDSFGYSETQKGLSWSREPETENFILGATSKNLVNPKVIPEISLSPTISPTLTLTSTPSPTETTAINPTVSASPIMYPLTSTASQQKKSYKYDLNNIKLATEEKPFADRKTRLVFLGKTERKAEILNAIIGSSLIILSSLFLIYVKIKGKRS